MPKDRKKLAFFKHSPFLYCYEIIWTTNKTIFYCYYLRVASFKSAFKCKVYAWTHNKTASALLSKQNVKVVVSSLHEAGVYFIFPSRPVSSSVCLIEWLKTLSPHSTFLSSARSSCCQAVDHACMHISHSFYIKTAQ